MRYTMQFPKAAAAICMLALAGAPVLAHETSDKREVKSAVEGERITLTGKVKSVTGERFTLDFGKEEIVVEMDDYDWYNENALVKGDRVTVTGRMDNDFYEGRVIEAGSVYVRKLDTYFYAAPTDEEEGLYSDPVNAYPWDKVQDDEWFGATGTVVSIDGKEIMLDTGLRTIRVDTSGIPDSPVGTVVDVGDRVMVTGEMDDADMFDKREMEAISIVILMNN